MRLSSFQFSFLSIAVIAFQIFAHEAVAFHQAVECSGDSNTTKISFSVMALSNAASDRELKKSAFKIISKGKTTVLENGYEVGDSFDLEMSSEAHSALIQKKIQESAFQSMLKLLRIKAGAAATSGYDFYDSKSKKQAGLKISTVKFVKANEIMNRCGIEHTQDLRLVGTLKFGGISYPVELKCVQRQGNFVQSKCPGQKLKYVL